MPSVATMLSPSVQIVSSFPFTPVGKPPLPSEARAEEERKVVIIKEFARESHTEKENSPVDIEKMATEEVDNCSNSSEETELSDMEDLEEPVSPPPSEPNDIVIVEDDDEEEDMETSIKTSVIKEPTKNNNTAPALPETGLAVAGLIRKLLDTTADPVVRWEDQSRGEFRVVSPALLARRIQLANPAQPITALRCDRGVFESVPGKPLVFRFGGTPTLLNPRPSPTPARASPPPAPTRAAATPRGGRKTYAQKISELQKPIPGLASTPTVSSMQLQLVPKDLPRILPARAPGMPALIPLTVDDMAGREAAGPPGQGLHLSGGGVSGPATGQEVPRLEALLAAVDPELPLDLSRATTKRRADSPVEGESKRARLEAEEKERRRVAQAEACKKYRASRKTGRKCSTEQEIEELWTFFRAALHNPEYNPRVVCWESIEDGEFRIANQEEFLQAWQRAKGVRLVRETLKKRVRACEEAELVHSRPHTRLGYRFGARAEDWRPAQGELVEQGRRMVPSRLSWPRSRFYQEFKQEFAVKQEVVDPEVVAEPKLELPEMKTEVQEEAAAPSQSPPPLFTLTPLVTLDLPVPVARPVQLSELSESADMTECEEFPCRLVLPRHRGYHAKLRLGDGLTIPLDRKVFQQIEEAMREALRASTKGGRAKMSGQDRAIANAVVRKAKRQSKTRAARKTPEAEETAEGGSMPLLDEEDGRAHATKTSQAEETEIPQETEVPQESEVPQEIDVTQKTEVSRETESPQEPEVLQETEVPEETDEPQAEARHRLPDVVAAPAMKSVAQRLLPKLSGLMTPGV